MHGLVIEQRRMAYFIIDLMHAYNKIRTHIYAHTHAHTCQETSIYGRIKMYILRTLIETES